MQIKGDSTVSSKTKEIVQVTGVVTAPLVNINLNPKWKSKSKMTKILLQSHFRSKNCNLPFVLHSPHKHQPQWSISNSPSKRQLDRIFLQPSQRQVTLRTISLINSTAKTVFEGRKTWTKHKSGKFTHLHYPTMLHSGQQSYICLLRGCDKNHYVLVIG